METRQILAKHSFEELEALLIWFHHRGPLPIIIGGWAVYFYNSYLGSVDIDLVSPSYGGQFDDLLVEFEITRGYQKIGVGPLGIGTAYRKEIIVNGEKKGYVEIDACTYEAGANTFHENDEKLLPFELCSRKDLVTEIKLNHNLLAFIPRKPLLFLYKLKALRDREYDLATKGARLSAERLEWLRGKRIKDGSDLIALLDPAPDTSVVNQEFDVDIFHNIVDEYGLGFTLQSLETLPKMNDSLLLYKNIEREIVVDWIKRL